MDSIVEEQRVYHQNWRDNNRDKVRAVSKRCYDKTKLERRVAHREQIDAYLNGWIQ